MIDFDLINFSPHEVVWASSHCELNELKQIFSIDFENFLEFDSDLNKGYSKYSIAKWFPEKKKIVLKRDIFGSIPIFFVLKPKSNCLVSDSLSDFHGKIDFDVNFSRVYGYLENKDSVLKEYGCQTFFKNVYQVPPGCIVIIDEDGVKVKMSEYTNLKCNKGNLLHYLNSVLHEKLTRKDKIAVHVSGGVDSTSIASVIENNFGNNMEIIYCATDVGFNSCSENSYQNSFEAKFGRKIEYISSKSCLNELTKQYFKFAYQPPLLFNTIALFENSLSYLKSRGVYSLITGHGGDQVLDHGFDYMKVLLSNREYSEIKKIIMFLTTNQILKNNYKNWFDFSYRKRFNLTLQYFLFPVKEIFLAELSLIDYIKSGGGFINFLESFLKSVFKKVFQMFRPSSIKYVMKECPNFFIDLANSDEHYKIRNLGTSNMNETFLNLERIFGVDIFRPFLDTRIYAASISYSLFERFGGGIGRNHFRLEMNSILPDVIRDRVDKTSFNEYFTAEMQKYAKQVGEIPVEHKVWSFIKKNKFKYHIGKISNNKISYFDKVGSAHYLHKALNIKLWLDFVSTLK